MQFLEFIGYVKAVTPK